MTWRERIANDRAAGALSRESRDLWGNPFTCIAAEAARAYGLRPQDVITDWKPLWQMGTKAFGLALKCDWDAVERLFDAIEDRALQLKRAAGSSHAPASAESDEAAS